MSNPRTHQLPGGGFVHVDRVVVPVKVPRCDICGKTVERTNSDEGGDEWCDRCIDEWEVKNQQHWEDGTPLNGGLE